LLASLDLIEDILTEPERGRSSHVKLEGTQDDHLHLYDLLAGVRVVSDVDKLLYSRGKDLLILSASNNINLTVREKGRKTLPY